MASNGTLSIVCVSVVSGVMGAVSMFAVRAQTQAPSLAPQGQEILTVRGIRVIDGEGREIAFIGDSADGTILRLSDGVQRTTPLFAVALGGAEDVRLTMGDVDRSRSRIELNAGATESFLAMSSAGAHTSSARVLLGAAVDGGGLLLHRKVDYEENGVPKSTMETYYRVSPK